MIVYRELSSLEADLGVSAKVLYMLSNELEKHYRRVELKKRDGSLRVLSVPDGLLKSVQRKIASKILAYYPVSAYATAYKDGAGVQKNALPHVGKEKVLKLDIQHFFDSILYSQVKDIVFPSDRFSEQNRILLSMLCYYKEVLPQGAPTSPVITNIIMRDFDEKVGAWCSAGNIAYTRYCDDMTFSGSFDDAEVISFVAAELKKRGFFLNKKKTVSASCNRRQTVTGIVVNEKPNVSSDYRKSLRQEVYYCRKFGVAEHLKRIGSSISPEKYLQKLLGRLSFVLQTSPDNRSVLRDRDHVLDLIKKCK